jgi:NAD(P)H-hydrate repair Nnr-like enzyme with NAD(P)H-hydrate dehydratase domain
LTPHPLEAARLLASSVADVQRDRLGAARALAVRYGCTALLKGSGSIVCAAAPDALPSINTSGNAALATPGSGDVLAGVIGAFWSQCAATDRLADDAATLATRAAVDLHGRVAQSMSPWGAALPASRLAAGVGDWLRRQTPPADRVPAR